MNTVLLIGFKSSGKSCTGKALAGVLGLPFTDTDIVAERLYRERNGEALNCREIYIRHGAEAMRALETDALRECIQGEPGVISTGGGAVLHPDNRYLIKKSGYCIFLDTPLHVLEMRLREHLSSPLFAIKSVQQVHGERYRLYTSLANLHYVPEAGERPEEIAQHLRPYYMEYFYG